MESPTALTPIRIAFCITELDRGGAELAMTKLVLGLDRREWHPRVFCLGPKSDFYETLVQGGVEVECLDARGWSSFPRVLFQLTRRLRQFRPHLLQTFLFHANFIGRIAGRLAKVPRIVSGIRVAEKSSRWHLYLDRWTNWLVDHNVCVSQAVADFSIREINLNPAHLTVIPNSVEFDVLANALPVSRVSLGIAEDAAVCITIGRLVTQKGIDVLLEALPVVLKRFPSCLFVIVGEGIERASLEKLAEKLRVGNYVRFLGHRQDVPGLLAMADVFVLPSRWEGMSNALLEAMASGTPVVATAVEGATELIRPHENGLLVPPVASRELANAICSVLGSPEDARRMSLASQCVVAKNYTSESIVGAYCKLYRELLGNVVR